VWQEATEAELTHNMELQMKEQGSCNLQECIEKSENYKNCIFESVKLNMHEKLTNIWDEKFKTGSKPVAVSPGGSDSAPNQERCE
jgi:hypothetical protein